MFSDTGPQTSCINFRLKNATSASSLPIHFVGREIKVADLREKIAERLQAANGQHLILYDGSSGKIFSDAEDKVPAYTEILVVRTIEESSAGGAAAAVASRKPSAAVSGMTSGSSVTGGAAGDAKAAAAPAMTKTATGETKRAELDFGGSGPIHGKGMTEEEAIAALADDVARDTGAGTAQFGGRGAGGGGNRGGGGAGRGGAGAAGMMNNNNNKPLVLSNSNPLGQAPSERVTCILCGNKGHWPSECPELQAAKNAGRGNNSGGGTHVPRRFAMATGIPESELEFCSKEEASHLTSKGEFVRRRVVGLSMGGLLGVSTDNNFSSSSASFKCLHCGAQSNDVAFFRRLPCGTAKCCIACKNCVANDKFMNMSDDGPVCVKCGNEIDADEIRTCKAPSDFAGTDALIGGAAAIRRDREE